ncbi:hypothetical protein CU044_1298 [Streptomyces sp. L-9-10]|uniref:hypothetical protein n=1 Tax=Streptomyces sp. L-9-10 TaxID=1478131 RepID=UPI00101CA7E9|nr:hypothetical protein [Streptomyces sp. L-9-10]RYJ30563.1 hypothetical protein CU044_1298 [Streptomyces sp. L-9-10]
MTLTSELALSLGLMASQALQPSFGAGPAHVGAGSGTSTQVDDIREPWLSISPHEVVLMFEGATLS